MTHGAWHSRRAQITANTSHDRGLRRERLRLKIKTGARTVKSPPGRPAPTPRTWERYARPDTSLARIAICPQKSDPDPVFIARGIPQQLPGRDAHTALTPRRPEGQTGGAAQRSRPGGPRPSPGGEQAQEGSPGCHYSSRVVHLTVEGHKCLLRTASAARSPALSRSRHFPRAPPPRDSSAQARLPVTLTGPPPASPPS